MWAASQSAVFEIHTDEVHARQALDVFAAEYGETFSKGFPSNAERKDGLSFVVEGKHAIAGHSWDTVDPRSLLARAFGELWKSGMVTKDAELVQCRYSLRPWITRDLHATESIEGTFILRTAKGEETWPFRYQPESGSTATEASSGNNRLALRSDAQRSVAAKTDYFEALG